MVRGQAQENRVGIALQEKCRDGGKRGRGVPRKRFQQDLRIHADGVERALDQEPVRFIGDADRPARAPDPECVEASAPAGSRPR